MGRAEELNGRKFERWTVIPSIILKDGYVLCRCDCGTVKSIFYPTLINGRSKSCGCYRKEVVSKHGMSETRFYNIWKNIIRRIESPYATGYSGYGGRGILLSEEWHDFNLFKRDMYESYIKHVNLYNEKDTTIERDNNNGDYCKENCRWATMGEQRLNTRCTKRYLVNGEYLTPVEISRKYNLDYGTVVYRLRAHWPIEEVISRPSGVGRRKKVAS
ncbi:MAG TPA: hypothetical protein VFC58_09410 [Desulfosporosinus sp.]|nr:hypothetical protein [Desulfosporosinus sp.]